MPADALPPSRKPLAKSESLPAEAQKRRPRTVYFTDAEWELIVGAARRRLMEPSPLVRHAAIHFVRMLQRRHEEEASLGMAEGWR